MPNREEKSEILNPKLETSTNFKSSNFETGAISGSGFWSLRVRRFGIIVKTEGNAYLRFTLWSVEFRISNLFRISEWLADCMRGDRRAACLRRPPRSGASSPCEKALDSCFEFRPPTASPPRGASRASPARGRSCLRRCSSRGRRPARGSSRPRCTRGCMR